MCIAIYKPANIVIDKDTLHRCYLKNKDGCGFAYFRTDGELVICKAMDFATFYEDYEFHSVLNADRPFLIHFRIATHGTVDLYNCHPFQIDDKHVMIHNGIIHNIRKCPDKKRSDTQMFVDDILKELPPQWMFNWGITNLIEDYIGASKVVVLAADDSVTIYNEIKGEWNNEVWYSNGGYKEVVRYSHGDDYYSQRYREKTTPYNYERPDIDPTTGEKVGTLYGRWEYDSKVSKCVWIAADRPKPVTLVKSTVDEEGSVWQKDETTGDWGWFIEKDDTKPLPIWKYNNSLGMMEEFIDGVATGRSYMANKREKKQQHLALVKVEKQKPVDLEYETCASCCRSIQTDEIYEVDEFKDAECYICKTCMEEFIATGVSMTNPVRVSDIKALEKEVQNVC